MSERAAEALAEYWDALTLGRSIESGDVDPALAEVIRRFRTVADVPGPEPEFIARLERALVESSGSFVQPAPVLVRLHGHEPPWPEPRAGDRVAPPTVTTVTGRGPARRAAAHLATAALLLLTLAAGFVAVRGGVVAPDAPPAPAKAYLVATPDPSTAEGVLLQATVAGVPSIPGYIGVDRWSFAAHSGPWIGGPVSGPTLMFVTRGRLTATVAHSAQIKRGIGATHPSPLAPDVPTELAAGDSLVVPADVAYSVANDQASLASALVFSTITDKISDWEYPQFDSSLIQDEMLVSDTGATRFPPGSMRVELRRTTLAPGATIPAAAPGAYQLVASETKVLGYLGRGPDGRATNKEAEPLGVVVVTIRPAALDLTHHITNAAPSD